MTAEELVKAGRLDEALTALQQEIRQQPSEARLRAFLFQLLMVLGQWERALTQLQVLAELDPEMRLMAHVYRGAIQCEHLRGEVFTGRRTPVILGEAEEWMGWIVHANQLACSGQWQPAAELRDRAFEAAPASAGALNEKPFEWIADADSRMGPMLEAFIDGRYVWVPFPRVKRLVIEPPGHLKDFVWCPVHFLWTNGGEAAGFIPTRYPHTETHRDPSLLLARKTDWIAKDGGYYFGLGQRTLATSDGDLALLEVRRIDLHG